MQAIPCSKGHCHQSNARDSRPKAAAEEGLWPPLPQDDLEKRHWLPFTSPPSPTPLPLLLWHFLSSPECRTLERVTSKGVKRREGLFSSHLVQELLHETRSVCRGAKHLLGHEMSISSSCGPSPLPPTAHIVPTGGYLRPRSHLVREEEEKRKFSHFTPAIHNLRDFHPSLHSLLTGWAERGIRAKSEGPVGHRLAVSGRDIWRCLSCSL